MSYPQPPQWGPQGYYPPPQKSNTGKVILLLALGVQDSIKDITLPTVEREPQAVLLVREFFVRHNQLRHRRSEVLRQRPKRDRIKL